MDSSRFCKYCGEKIKDVRYFTKQEDYKKIADQINDDYDDVEKQDVHDSLSKLELQNEQLRRELEEIKSKEVDENVIKCPYCGCTKYHFEKKGFSTVKAVAGYAIVGAIGVVGGNIGANESIRKCDNCGKEF